MYSPQDDIPQYATFIFVSEFPLNCEKAETNAIGIA